MRYTIVLILTLLSYNLTLDAQNYMGHTWNDDNGLPALHLHFDSRVEPELIASLWKKYLFRQWINTRGFEFKRMLVSDDGVILAIEGEKTRIEPTFLLLNVADKHTVIFHNSLFSIEPYSDPNKQYVKGMLEGFRQHILQYFHSRELKRLEHSLSVLPKNQRHTEKKLASANKRAEKMKRKLEAAEGEVLALEQKADSLKTEELTLRLRMETAVNELTSLSNPDGMKEDQ